MEYKNLACSLGLLTVAALSSQHAAAQSNVVIGGFIKGGVDSTSTTGATNPAGNKNSAARISDNTSYWYVDGKEDLGGGLNAFFHMEWDFGIDTGGTGAGRNFGVGLGGSWGKVTLGRWATYFSNHFFIENQGATDAAPLAANSLNILGSINGGFFAGGFLSNVVRYDSPRWNGFATTATYSFDSETAGRSGNHSWNINPTYVQGPATVMFSHLQRNEQNLAVPAPLNLFGGAGNYDQRADRLGAAYQFGSGLRIAALWDRNRVYDAAGATTLQRDAWSLPASYRNGLHLFELTYGQARPMSRNGAKVDNTGARMLSATYDYTLSKRTSVALSYATVTNQSAGQYDFWARSLGGNVSPALPAISAGAESRMLYAGIRHYF